MEMDDGQHCLNIHLKIQLILKNFIIFHYHQKTSLQIDLFIDGNKISWVSETKFLEIVIDSNLSWKCHINNLTSACNVKKYRLN